jgi:hypothetical protein
LLQYVAARSETVAKQFNLQSDASIALKAEILVTGTAPWQDGFIRLSAATSGASRKAASPRVLFPWKIPCIFFPCIFFPLIVLIF